ncbi:hypothetical protein AC249_AIPGENE21428, partial [Exaiptasia diaphana]
NLSNSGQQIKWSALSSLKNLKELDLTGNNVNCNCDYYKYWKNNIHPSSGLKIKGACAEPSSRKGRSLSQVGAGMKQECDRSKLFDKTSPHVVISTQKPMQSYSQKQIKPTATLSSSTATSETEVLKSAGPVKIGSIKESSSKAMPSTTSAKETMSFFSLVVKLSEEKYSDDYKDKGSVKFRDLQSRLNKALSYVFNEFYGFYGATLLSARSGSVIADVLIKTTNSTRDRAKKILEENIQTAKFGSIPVDRGSYYFKDKTEVCPGEFLNVTWSDMLVNETAIAECPRGAKGTKKTTCTI